MNGKKRNGKWAAMVSLSSGRQRVDDLQRATRRRPANSSSYVGVLPDGVSGRIVVI